MSEQKSIAELWVEFQDVNRKIKSQQFVDWMRVAKHQMIQKQHALRAELLELCKRVLDSSSEPIVFRPTTNSPFIVKVANRSPLVHSPITALEMSAAYAFWAWELEQRQKESEVGNV